MQKYVLGLAFSEDRSSVLLIKKNRPEWQKGKLNGIGGHIEDTDLCPLSAMVREFEEETGIKSTVSEWSLRAEMTDHVNFIVYVYYRYNNDIYNATTMTDEKIEIVELLDDGLNQLFDRSVSNMVTLIGLGLDSDMNRIIMTLNYSSESKPESKPSNNKENVRVEYKDGIAYFYPNLPVEYVKLNLVVTKTGASIK